MLNKWGKWQDLAAGYLDEHYLLQGRRSANGKVQFRVEKSIRTWGVRGVTLEDVSKILPPSNQ